ncbi:T9SS type A sorting domain-containing protein [Aquimarina agarivorans]|uniref:T9SS type A sorting domain-containing protein n=1 Tax=Aquimarina agarivorans TaxID=980584 RepID=UPI000248EA75|nr:spondin domain-containing protein [Aquimarina agarivorans]
MKKLITNTLYGIVLGFASMHAQISTVEYTVEFTSNWEAHGPLPMGGPRPHFTNLVVATHNNNVTFFEMGELASPGTKNVAEFGSNGEFISEVNAEIPDNAFRVIEGPDLFFDGARRDITIENFEVNSDFPLLTLASMIAPSPDWMVAVNSLNLQDASGSWIPEITMDLFAYDAGTRSNKTYDLGGPLSSPVEPITRITTNDTPINPNLKMGTLVISLNESTLSADDFDYSDYVDLDFFPNPAKETVRVFNIDNSGLETVEIFNITGSLVKTAFAVTGEKTLDIDVSNLSQGLYLMKLTTNTGESQTKRLTITK